VLGEFVQDIIVRLRAPVLWALSWVCSTCHFDPDTSVTVVLVATFAGVAGAMGKVRGPIHAVGQRLGRDQQSVVF
jgi:hypothetical protein